MNCQSKSESQKTVKNLEIQLKEIGEINQKNINLSLAIQYPNSDYLYCTNDIEQNDTLKLFRLNLNSFKINLILNIKKPNDFEAYAIDEQNEMVYIFADEKLRSYNNKKQLSKEFSIDMGDSGFIINLNPSSFYPYITDEKLFVEYFLNDEDTYTSKEFYNAPFQAIIDLETEDIRLMDMIYPSDYQHHTYGFNFIPDRFFTDNNLQIATFPYNDSAYIYNLLGEKLKTEYFGTHSSHDFQYIPYTEIDKLQPEVFDNFNSDMPFYGFSTSVPNQSIYVRHFFFYNQEEKKLENTMILYNNDWNYIGELKLNKNMTIYGSKKHGLICLQKEKNESFKIFKVNYE